MIMERICVFCGSSTGFHPIYEKMARDLGEQLAAQSIDLVYGGGSIGLMGILADKVLECGGKVIGVIPRFLYEQEVGHDEVSELIIVDSMHERKQTMAELARGFVALPGGIGTLEELFEIFTWSQLELIKRPIAVLNINGFFDHASSMLNHMVHEGFLKQSTRDMLIEVDNIHELLIRMQAYTFTEKAKSIDKT